MGNLSLGFIVSITVVATAHAASHQFRKDKLSESLRETIYAVNTALSSSGSANKLQHNSDDWEMNQFQLKIGGIAKIELQGIANVQFIPNIELFFDREIIHKNRQCQYPSLFK